METFRYHSVNIRLDNEVEFISHWITSSAYTRYVILTDKNCYKEVLPLLKKQLPILKKADVIVIKPGEKNKNLQTTERIINQLIKLEADKHTLLINLGGGVVSDIGGFVASVYKRGIAYINIPTSMLAMVDAAIGSKTAIDFNGVKNIIGSVYHPKLVWINTTYLKTLPFDELMNGIAESFKHGLCDSQTHLDIVIQQLEKMNLEMIIRQSVAYKCELVNKDLYDLNIRKTLNLGHTTGHAIESLLLNKQLPVMHGMCVFYGIVAALLLSEKLFSFPQNISNELIQKIKRYCPVLSLKMNQVNIIIKSMRQDKKNSNGEIRMVLLKNIGEPIWDVAVKEKQIEQALRATIEIMNT